MCSRGVKGSRCIYGTRLKSMIDSAARPHLTNVVAPPPPSNHRRLLAVSSIMQQLLRVIESDESGAVTATYESDKDSVSVCSIRFTTFCPGLSVADYSQQSQLQKAPLLQQLVHVFLPAGFPASVTEDYVGYAALRFTRHLNLSPLSHTIIQKLVSI